MSGGSSVGVVCTKGLVYSFCLCVSACLSLCVSIYLSVSLSVCLYVLCPSVAVFLKCGINILYHRLPISVLHFRFFFSRHLIFTRSLLMALLPFPSSQGDKYYTFQSLFSGIKTGQRYHVTLINEYREECVWNLCPPQLVCATQGKTSPITSIINHAGVIMVGK